MTSTRDRLIDSTRELLWDRGYVGTSPKAIQELSGAGQGSIGLVRKRIENGKAAINLLYDPLLLQKRRDRNR